MPFSLRMIRAARAYGLLALLVACTPAEEGDLPPLGGLAQELGTPLPSCSEAASSGYDTTTKLLTLSLGGGVTDITLSAESGELHVNGWTCVSGTGVSLTTATVAKISITGTSANEKVILDLSAGSFGNVLSPTKGGIVVDLATGTDGVTVLGTTNSDKMAAGASASGDVYLELTGDNKADVRATAIESVTLSLNDGNDTFQAMGGAISAAHLDPTVTSLLPLTLGVEVYGGDGNDTLQGGNGDDTLHGGNGNDTFKTAIADDGADLYDGGDGTDLVDYSPRTGSVDVSIAEDGVADADDGLANEGDDVTFSVENVTGGSGDDVLAGSSAPNTITGGAGDDVLSGGVGGACEVDVDVLSGGNGDDHFDMGSASNCGDAIAGGAGKDTVDYGSRTANVAVSLDTNANDGELGEGDKVGLDVEVVLGGSGNDTLVGGSAADELHGGPGDDTLLGGAGHDTLVGGPGDDTMSGDNGNDTFLESGNDAAYAPAIARGAGDDVANGGAGTDAVSYASRTGDLVVTLCVDPGDTVGAPTSASLACTDADGEGSEADNLVNIERLEGGSGNDALTGGSANEIFEGNDGDDVIAGGAGDDTIWGDAGDDTLAGDDGEDALDGGAGDDALSGGTGAGDICVPDASDSAAPQDCELTG